MDALSSHTPTAADLVDELVSSFALCLQLYAQWRRCRGRQNHYRKPGSTGGAKPLATAPCALSTSLAMGSQVKETFRAGLNLLGPDYADGDNTCCRALTAQQGLLHDQTIILWAASASEPGPLDIHVILQASETARLGAIQALVAQYRRMAISQTSPAGLPRELAVPRWRPSRQGLRASKQERMMIMLPDRPPPPPSSRWMSPPRQSGQSVDGNDMQSVWSRMSESLVFSSEPPTPMSECPPPSPPPSPPLSKLTVACGARRPSNTQALLAATASARPNNSVFHIFCPEALALQVDVNRAVPATRKCLCGFRWLDKTSASSSLLKDGFCMSPRFLAKSHCEGAQAGFGCVLCTSSGKASKFATAWDLRTHLNAAHDKWQMLHDRDMT